MRFAQLAALVVATVACAADPVPITACTAGASVSCTCSSGATGAQVCRADGSGFGACVCTSGDAAVGDVVDAQSVDASRVDDAAVGDASGEDVIRPDIDGRCPGTLHVCNGRCIPLQDQLNCGRCGVSCSDGYICVPRGIFAECVPPDAGADASD